MSAPFTVLATAVPPQPWRNGGGVTRELLAWPSPADWQVRLSLADIAADGPFSRYDGVQRWFAVLSGAGVRLTLGGRPHRLVPGDAPLRFSGDAPVDCRLIDGPTRDVNLMLRGRRGGLLSAQPGAAWSPPADAVLAGLLTAVPVHCHGQALPAQTLCGWAAPAVPATLQFHPTDTAGTHPTGWWWWAGPPEDAAA